MFNKNLKYYRLKKNMSKKELASLCSVSPMVISYYESGERKPSMETMKKLALSLGVKVSDFLAVRNENLVFCHGKFRKNSTLTQAQQEFVRESVEEYFGRFYSALEFLGGDVLPQFPECYSLPLSNDAEVDAAALRQHLNLSSDGPIDDLIGVLENKGILVMCLDIDNDKFSGMNGFVGNRPYIVINKGMTAERNRSTIVHELAHLMFDWSDNIEGQAIESHATAIAGAFLLPREDAIRELGVRRSRISRDMLLVCEEYGISMALLVKRARLANVITQALYTEYNIRASKAGWRKREPTRIECERPRLFEQLVYRAVTEQEISVQRGAELLKTSYNHVVKHCFFNEDSQ